MLILKSVKEIEGRLTAPQNSKFEYPRSGWVEAPDWNPNPEIDCGQGLHGLLWGEGNACLLYNGKNAVGLVIEADESDVLPSQNGKNRFRGGNVVFVGSLADATRYIYDNGGAGRAIAYLSISAGYGGTAIAGHEGTAIAGYGGTAIAGDDGTATTGHEGTATAGDEGTATVGDRGRATAGNEGTAIAGDGGAATAGDYGTATAGDGGTATAGDYGIIQIAYWKKDRKRIAIGYIGENGLKPNVPYRLNNEYEFVEVK